MEGFAVGEIVVLDGEKEFFCYKKAQDNGKTYLFMMSNFKPLEIFFAEEIVDGDTAKMRRIGNPEEKKRVLALFEPNSPLLNNPQEQNDQEKEEQQEKPVDVVNPDGDSLVYVGETLVLANKGNYDCVHRIRYNGTEYLCLLSHAKPREIMYAQAVLENNVLSVKVVSDLETLQQLRAYRRKHPFEAFKQIFQDRPHVNKLHKKSKSN